LPGASPTGPAIVTTALTSDKEPNLVVEHETPATGEQVAVVPATTPDAAAMKAEPDAPAMKANTKAEAPAPPGSPPRAAIPTPHAKPAIPAAPVRRAALPPNPVAHKPAPAKPAAERERDDEREPPARRTVTPARPRVVARLHRAPQRYDQQQYLEPQYGPQSYMPQRYGPQPYASRQRQQGGDMYMYRSPYARSPYGD
jgi:hypothetical protein